VLDGILGSGGATMTTEAQVARHYTHGALERTILEALQSAGRDLDRLEPSDLAPVDEFHIGGRQATVDFAEALGVGRGMHLLDVGSGLGGASRYFAHAHDCTVVGLDLTDEYVRVADLLAQRTGLGGRVSYRRGSALALPFPRATFDVAYMLHVGMNIADKAALFGQVRGVLKPGGLFGIYDVMREGEGAFGFPVPWASSAESSFVESAASYKRLLAAAGFTVLKERSRREFAVRFFHELRARLVERGTPPLGLHLLMGESTPQKVGNMVAAVESGVLAPTELICRVA
jgi:ubiquinone/menaquinone biosynthesis C-methylase UbiE